MNSITTDKHVQFVLENYADISSLDELVMHAKSKVPGILEKLVHKCIDELEEQLQELGMEIDSSKDWYNPDMYDSNKGTGLYFGCAGNFDYMFDGDDPDNAPYLYLRIATDGIKTKKGKIKYVDEQFAKISDKKIRAKFKKSRIAIEEIDYDDSYMLSYSLFREINLQTIMDKENLVKAVKKAILSFTNVVMRSYPEN